MIATNEPVVIMTRREFDDLIRQAATQAADAAVARIKTSAEPADELWDAKQVGAYLGLAAYTVAQSKSLERGFPAAIVMGSGPKARRRWKAGEIRKWADRARKAA